MTTQWPDDRFEKEGMLVFLGMKLVGKIKDGVFIGQVIHQYTNPTEDRDIEAIMNMYAPLGAVIHGMECRIGDGEFQKAEVVEKDEADSQYEATLQAGHSAVLVEPSGNVGDAFCVSAGNLRPKDIATVRMGFSTKLELDGDNLRLIVPTTEIEKYGNPFQSGIKDYQVPEMSSYAINPFDAEITVEGKLAEGEVSSPNPRVVIRKDENKEGGALIKVKVDDYAVMDRDFILDIKPSAKHSKDYVLSETVGGLTYVMARTFAEDNDARRRTANMKVLVDNSGSMLGGDIELARHFISALASSVRPGDSYTLSKFGTDVEHYAQRPIESRGTMRDFARKQDAEMGGTNVAEAIEAVTTLRGTENLKDVLLVSDGAFYGAEKVVRIAHRTKHRCFTVGVGNAAHGELRKIAERTGGKYFTVTKGDDIGDVAQRVINGIRSFKATSYDIHRSKGWPDGLEWKVLPKNIWDNHSVDLFACFSQPPKGKVSLGITSGNGWAPALHFELDKAKHMEGLHKLVQGEYIKHLENSGSTAKGVEKALDWQILGKGTTLLYKKTREGKNKGAGRLSVIKIKNMTPQGSFGSVFETGSKLFYRAEIKLRDDIARHMGLASHQIPIDLPYFIPDKFFGYSLCIENFVIVKEKSLARLMVCFLAFLRWMMGKRTFGKAICYYPGNAWCEGFGDKLGVMRRLLSSDDLKQQIRDNIGLLRKELQKIDWHQYERLSDRMMLEHHERFQVNQIASKFLLRDLFDNDNEETFEFIDSVRFVLQTYRKLCERDFIVLGKALGIRGQITVHKVSKSNWDSGLGPRID